MPLGTRRQPSTGLFTVVNTFTLKDPSNDEQRTRFEMCFLAHVAWMRGQQGFDSHQAVRLADRPDMYVNIGRWRTPESFQRMRGSTVFRAHAGEFRELVYVDDDPSRNVLRAGRETGNEGAPVVVVEWLRAEGMNLERLDRSYRAYAASLVGQDGFVHADLSRSLTRPGAYTFITWWSHEAAWRAARPAAPATGAAECAVHLAARAVAWETARGAG